MNPITPQEAEEYSEIGKIPEFIFTAFNALIKEKMTVRGAFFTQDEVIIRAMHLAPPGVTRQDLFDRGWLDVEPYYAKVGWKVTYDKPDPGEDGSACFIFKKA